MLLKCDIVTANRLAPSHNSRKSFATICLGKKVNQKTGDEVVTFTIVTGKSKTGITYLVSRLSTLLEDLDKD